jgi:hypothetical protein
LPLVDDVNHTSRKDRDFLEFVASEAFFRHFDEIKHGKESKYPNVPLSELYVDLSFMPMLQIKLCPSSSYPMYDADEPAELERLRLRGKKMGGDRIIVRVCVLIGSDFRRFPLCLPMRGTVFSYSTKATV